MIQETHGQEKRRQIYRNTFINAFVNLYNESVVGPPGGHRSPAFTQVFCTSHAQKLPEIHVHAKFTNHVGCQIDYSRNKAIFPSYSRFLALKYVE